MPRFANRGKEQDKQEHARRKTIQATAFRKSIGKIVSGTGIKSINELRLMLFDVMECNDSMSVKTFNAFLRKLDSMEKILVSKELTEIPESMKGPFLRYWKRLMLKHAVSVASSSDSISKFAVRFDHAPEVSPRESIDKLEEMRL